jgi:hypothetical protein
MVLSGANFYPTQLDAVLEDGTVASVQVGAWHQETPPGLPAMDYYVVSNPADGSSICGNNADSTPTTAMPLVRTFDQSNGKPNDLPNLFTFACYGGALEKCNRYGYPDWISRQETFGTSVNRTIDNYHDACVFMVRADYCGDGQTHTYTGTTIDIYDNLSFNTQATSNGGADGFFFEAEWGDDGAWCINKTRWMPIGLAQTLANNQSASNPDWAYIQSHCPERIAGNPWPGNPDGTGHARPCDTQSNFFPNNGGFSMDQTQRPLLRNNSMLYQN